MKVRIELSKVKLHKLRINSDYSEDLPTLGDQVMTDAELSTSQLPSPGITIDFSCESRKLNQWTSQISGYPQGDVNFNFNSGDLSQVVGWFTGKYAGSTVAASTTLLRNVTTSAHTMIESYLSAAAQSNLVTSPLLIGWALRGSDGSRLMPREMKLVVPNNRAPLLNIAGYNIGDNSVNSIVNIINHPSALRFKLTKQLTDINWGKITHIEIVAAPQADLMPDDFLITGVGSVNVNGTPDSCYLYTRPESDSLLADASLQSDLRIIASIPVDQLPEYGVITDIPIINGAFHNWKQLEKYSDSEGNGSNEDTSDDEEPKIPGINDTWYPYVNLETEAMVLGNSEEKKRVRSVWLRGIYERGKVNISLYGARHRGEWHHLATGKQGWVGGMHGVGFRWWKVRIAGPMRKGDYLDALTFNILT